MLWVVQEKPTKTITTISLPPHDRQERCTRLTKLIIIKKYSVDVKNFITTITFDIDPKKKVMMYIYCLALVI